MEKFRGRLLLAVAAAALLAACASMQSRWEATTSADTIAAYENFLEEYPEGDRADQARVRRDELREERDWTGAEAEHTAAAYEDFRKRYPRGRHVRDADARLAMLSPTGGDDSPLVGAGKFLRRYRGGIFLDQAHAVHEKLAFDQAVTADTISAEQVPAKGAVPVQGGYGNRTPSGKSTAGARVRREKPRAAAEWGTIMYPARTINIRAKRSAASKLKGQLKTGQPVKADFLRDGWYAVFPVGQKQRNEKMAMGYVSAPLLKRGPDSPGPAAAEEKSATAPPPKTMETESLPVEVRRITFKVAGEGKELLLIEFDRFYTPAISGIEGNQPRIILEIKNASPFREERAAIDTGGNFIRRIRSSRDAETRAVRIVLDMAPEKSYFVSQAFYQKGNIYSLEISEQTEPPVP
ncbi:MAG: hypothetical protein ACYDAA_12115 [Syntrophales bacterium]